MKNIKKNKKTSVSNSPEEALLDRDYWLNKASQPYSVFEFVNKKKPFLNIFEFAPEEIKLDKEINLVAILKSFPSHLIHPSLLEDKDFVLSYIEKSNYPSLYSFKSFLNDDEIFLKAYKKWTHNYSSLPREKKYNKDYIIKLIHIDDSVFKDLHIDFRNDLDIAKLAVEKNYQHVRDLQKSTLNQLINTAKFANEILDKDPQLFPYVAYKLRNNLDFVRTHYERVKNYYSISFLEESGKKVKNDLGFMMELSDRGSIRYSSEELRMNEEFVLNNIRHYSDCIAYRHHSFNYLEFHIKAMKANSHVYPNIPKQFQSNPTIISILLNDLTNINELPKDVLISMKSKGKEENININDSNIFAEYVRSVMLQNSLNDTLKNKDDNKELNTTVSKSKLKI